MSDVIFDVIGDGSIHDVVVGNPTVDVVTVEGPPGPTGPAGDGGLSHTQASASATWTITNPLGRKPGSVTVWIDDELVDADVETPDTSTVVITFPYPVSGRVEIL